MKLTVMEGFVTVSCDVAIKHAQLATHSTVSAGTTAFTRPPRKTMQERLLEFEEAPTNFKVPGPGTTQGDDIGRDQSKGREQHMPYGTTFVHVQLAYIRAGE